MKNFLLLLISPFTSKVKLQSQLSLYQGRCEDLEIKLRQCEKQCEQFRHQVLGLRNWITHVHRLDTIPVRGTIEDILRNTR